ncbi:MAG: hypothetical protein GY765_10460, partial [bacterium]|nr:hypothetical protein [bacterium]
MKRIHFLITVSLALAIGLAGLTVYAASKTDTVKLSFDDVYKVKPFRGKNAKKIEFSQNDRYLSFLWNKYEDFNCRLLLRARDYQERGYDLFVYDISKKKKKRVTSLERMKQFDPPEDYEEFVKKRKQVLEEEEIQQQKHMLQRDVLEGKAKAEDLEQFEKKEIEKLKEELKKEKEE